MHYLEVIRLTVLTLFTTKIPSTKDTFITANNLFVTIAKIALLFVHRINKTKKIFEERIINISFRFLFNILTEYIYLCKKIKNP